MKWHTMSRINRVQNACRLKCAGILLLNKIIDNSVTSDRVHWGSCVLLCLGRGGLQSKNSVDRHFDTERMTSEIKSFWHDFRVINGQKLKREMSLCHDFSANYQKRLTLGCLKICVDI